MTERLLAEMVATALNDFAEEVRIAGGEYDVNKVIIDIRVKPHRPSGLPLGKIAIYCFFLDGQALKIGLVGPNSDARYRSQHYNENSVSSNVARSIRKHPSKIGVDPAIFLAISVGDWIKTHTDRINILLPARYGKTMLSRLETFLHMRWKPVYEGSVAA
jgi:hypothetical protein